LAPLDLIYSLAVSGMMTNACKPQFKLTHYLRVSWVSVCLAHFGN